MSNIIVKINQINY